LISFSSFFFVFQATDRENFPQILISPGVRHLFSTSVFSSEIPSCCPEYLAATKAAKSYFQLIIIIFIACNHWRNKELPLFAKLLPNSGTIGTIVAISITVWIYLY
jgi:hypothetical protein